MPATIIDFVEIGRRSLSVGEDGQISIRRTYAVEVDGTPSEDAIWRAILAAVATTEVPPRDVALDPLTGLPTGLRAGARYPSEEDPPTLAYVKSIDLDEDDTEDGGSWTLAVEFGPIRPRAENPLDEPISIEGGSDVREEVVDYDQTPGPLGPYPITNSAGDPFDPPVTRDRHDGVLTIVRNEAADPGEKAAYFRGTINEFTWKLKPPGTVKCEAITYRSAWHQNVPGGFYWIVTYSFLEKREGWYARPLDAGFRHLHETDPGDPLATPPVSPTYERRRVTIEGADATAPVPLDGAGAVLDVNLPGVYGEYLIHPLRDFAELLLDGETP